MMDWVARVGQLRQMVEDLPEMPVNRADVDYYLSSPEFFGDGTFDQDDMRFLEAELMDRIEEVE